MLEVTDAPRYALLAIKQLDHLFVTRGGQPICMGKAKTGSALSTVGHHIRIAASLREGVSYC